MFREISEKVEDAKLKLVLLLLNQENVSESNHKELDRIMEDAHNI